MKNRHYILKRKKIKNRIHRQELFYLDNSVVSKLRGSKKGKLCKIERRKRKYCKNICRWFHIKDILVTEKLFLEIIGEGQIRTKIVKANQKIKTFQQQTKDKILNRIQLTEQEVQLWHDFLEDLFKKALPVILPQHKLLETTLEQLEKYPFSKQHAFIKNKVIAFATKLSINKISYDQFISILVKDSVIRYTFEAFKIKNIPVTHYDTADDYVTTLNNFLLIKYVSDGLLSKDLILIASALIAHEESKENNNKKVKKLIRAEDDFADSEHQALFIYGLQKKGIRYSVSVFTAEPTETVKYRINAYMRGIKEIVDNNLGYQHLLAQHPANVFIGETLIVDLKNYNLKRIGLPQNKIYKHLLKQINTKYSFFCAKN